MKKLLLAGLLTLLLGEWSSHARASEPCYAPVCCAPPVCYKIECVPVRYVVQVPKCVYVPKMVSVCVPEPRVVERQVQCVRYVPAECTDHCGNVVCCTRPEFYMRNVQCVEYRCRYEQREVMCPTVTYEPREIVRHVYRCVAYTPTLPPAPCGMNEPVP